VINMADNQGSSSSSDSSSDSESSANIFEEEEEEEEEEVDPLRLKSPAFSVPNDDDCELWTIRLPGDFEASALDGIEFTMGAKEMGTVQSGESTYGFAMGDDTENESFRMLINDGHKGFMIPSQKSFMKHIKIVNEKSVKEIVGTELAPGVGRGPKPVDYVRHAYSSIPQKTGLKRRWMPMGVPHKAVESSTNKGRKKGR